jgi:DNA-binding transcriptional LysR family regulator
MAEQPGFTLIQLRYFVAAAETGSMTAAAERLVIAQSAISAAVSNLEKELRIQLFIRSGRDRVLRHARAAAPAAAAHRVRVRPSRGRGAGAGR